MTHATRRRFIAVLGASAGLTGLSGCLSNGLFRRGGAPDKTLYLGSYHWGFILLDESGTQREEVVVDRGTTIKLVTFNTSSARALERLPSAIQNAIPDHHELEERNEGRIPPPPDGDLHEQLEAANERYPDHSVAVMPSGGHHMGGQTQDGMMGHAMAMARDASGPTTATVTASTRGSYSFRCMTDCGYGHAYMDLDDALVVR